MLFVVGSMFLVGRGLAQDLGAAALLGCAGATYQIMGLKGAVALAIERGPWLRGRRGALLRLLVLISAGAVIALGLWAIHIGGDFGLVRIQGSALRSMASHTGLKELLFRDFPWSAGFFPAALLVMMIGWLGPARLAGDGGGQDIVRIARQVTLFVAADFVINLALERPYYYYRLSHLLCVGVIAAAAGLAAKRMARLWSRVGSGVVVIGLAIVSNAEIARFAAAPLAWNEESVSTEAAVELVRTVGGRRSVGGEGALWWVTEGRAPFYALRWVGGTKWPDVIVNSEWTRQPFVLAPLEFRRRILEEYQEIEVRGRSANNGCWLDVLGVRVPVATGTCDWRIRMWVRRGNELQERVTRVGGALREGAGE